jgi:hypothetical protein
MNGVFCAVRADGCVRNNGVCHATTKQQLHCDGGTVFSTPSVARCYKRVSEELVTEELFCE